MVSASENQDFRVALGFRLQVLQSDMGQDGTAPDSLARPADATSRLCGVAFGQPSRPYHLGSSTRAITSTRDPR